MQRAIKQKSNEKRVESKKLTIDEKVEKYHSKLMNDSDISLLAGVMKCYDPDYKPIRIDSQLFKEAKSKFITADSRQIGSMVELAMALQDMPDHVFRQHVNQFKHDFSNWAKDSFGEEFAEKLKNRKTRKDMKEFISSRLQEQIGLMRR